EAPLVRDREGGEVTVLTVGPDSATDAIREALSMGADKAVHVADEAIHGSDAIATSAVIAAALGRLEYDLVLCGAEATDSQMSVMPALLSERLGIPQLSGARKLTIEGGVAKVERQTDSGYWALEAPLPAIVSTWDSINEPRYPSFKGIMAAKKKPVESKSLADLGVAAAAVAGAPGAAAGAKGALAEYGAQKVYVAESGDIEDYLVAPKAEVLAALVERVSPAGVVIPSSPEGKEVAARLAVKTNSGFLTDVTEIAADGTATQVAFAGSVIVHSKVTTGTPIYTLRGNSVTPEPAPAAGAEQPVSVSI